MRIGFALVFIFVRKFSGIDDLNFKPDKSPVLTKWLRK